MPGVAVVTNKGQKTYTPLSGQSITGGMVVEATATAGRIQKAGAGSVKVLGVALADAIAPEQLSTAATTGADGRPVINVAVSATVVTVVSNGAEVNVTYAANAGFGDTLIAAANGTVTPAGATPDARTIVGRCTEPGGVVVGTKATGLMRVGN
jgi:hypothetical protein